MSDFVEKLQELIALYERVVAENAVKADAVDGDLSDAHLNVSFQRGANRFYAVWIESETGKKKRVYLTNPEDAAALAQREYQEKLVKRAKSRLHYFYILQKNYKEDELLHVYDVLSDSRRKLVKPALLTAEAWRAKPYERLYYHGEQGNHLTKNNELVRSKTEKILADMFYDASILYKYECPLRLCTGEKVYPDFTFFDEGLQQEIYWEHFGMMTNEEYFRKAMSKIWLYEQSGIHMGDRLIVSFESAETPLNYQWARAVMKQKLKPQQER